MEFLTIYESARIGNKTRAVIVVRNRGTGKNYGNDII